MDFLDLKETVKDFAKIILFVIVILFIITYVFSLQNTIGSSMEPNIKDGDILLLNKFKYRFLDIKRGDIIAFSHEDTNYMVKRVIGLPGETLEYKNQELYINDKKVEEDYLDDDVVMEDIDKVTIPSDSYYVLGDNRAHSTDSREFGFIKKNQILGQPMLVFWPLSHIKVVK